MGTAAFPRRHHVQSEVEAGQEEEKKVTLEGKAKEVNKGDCNAFTSDNTASGDQKKKKEKKGGRPTFSAKREETRLI